MHTTTLATPTLSVGMQPSTTSNRARLPLQSDSVNLLGVVPDPFTEYVAVFPRPVEGSLAFEDGRFHAQIPLNDAYTTTINVQAWGLGPDGQRRILSVGSVRVFRGDPSDWGG